MQRSGREEGERREAVREKVGGKEEGDGNKRTEEREGRKLRRVEESGQKLEATAHEGRREERESSDESSKGKVGRGTNRRARKPGAGGGEGARDPAAWRCTLPTATPREPAGGGKWGGEAGGGEDTRQGRHHAHGTGTDGHGTHGERQGQGIKQDATKQKQREKSGLVGVLSLGSGHTLEGGGQGIRQGERVDRRSGFSNGQVDLVLSSHPRPSFLTPAWSKKVPTEDQISILWALPSPTLMVSRAPPQDLSPLVVTCLFLNATVTPVL